MVELSIAQILCASSAIIANPSKNVFEELGISKVDLGLVIINPYFFAAKKAYEWLKNKIRANEEKERMYREIIQKQQAALNKQKEINRELERRLRESNASNAQNQEEIRRLRKQLENLEEVLKLLGKAQTQVA